MDEGAKVIEPKEKGHFNILIIIGAILGLLIIGGGGAYYFLGAKKKDIPKSNEPIATESAKKTGTKDIRWQLTGDGKYMTNGTPPECPSPIVLDPTTDLSKVVSILYPGQTRGGNYKPHGGFRFADGTNSDIKVTLPMDASVVEGGRYLVDGEIQYYFDFVNPCGIKYRLGHLRTLSAPFAAFAEKLPEAKEMDSRSTPITPPVAFKQGDLLATAVGILSDGNTFYDWGVYDLRKENEASKNPAYKKEHADDPGLSWHAVCWLDYLSTENTAKVKALPATSPGSQSDYCKEGVNTNTTSETSPKATTGTTSTDTNTAPIQGSGGGNAGSGAGSGGGGGGRNR